jgi:hypothetical protein
MLQVEENVEQSEVLAVHDGATRSISPSQHPARGVAVHDGQRGSTRVVDLNAREFSSMRKLKHMAVAPRAL